MPSHSNELERRITTVELGHDRMHGRVTYLERAVRVLIYSVAAIASGKSGDVVEVMVTLLKAKL